MTLNSISLKTACVALACAVALPACSTIVKASGAKKTTPNEFNILTKAPLVVPPEYNLRPPSAGQARPEDSYSSKAAREALIGDVDPAEPSAGESLLMAKAGTNKADPAVRVIIDGQNSVEHKSKGFSNRVIFWRDGKAVAADGTPLDPDTEARRMNAVKSATGGSKVEIQKRPTGSKLPGL